MSIFYNFYASNESVNQELRSETYKALVWGLDAKPDELEY